MAKNGGILGQINLPSNSSAPGRWGVKQVYTAIKEKNWPGFVNIEYLVVAGGGGGAGTNTDDDRGPGGGGAGGYRSSINGESSGGGASAEPALEIVSGQSFTITIGAGGAGSLENPVIGAENGSNSILSTITSIGGGYGGGLGDRGTSNGGDGGSGGGSRNAASAHVGGSGTAGQGYDGGDTAGGGLAGAGGGGAGGEGQSISTESTGGSGGVGVSSSVTGSSVTRATGGDGGDEKAAYSGSSGSANTGDGGEASGGDGGDGGNGGSGVVIARLQEGYDFTSIDPGLTYLVSTVEGKRVYQFTGGTGEVTVGELSPISYSFIGSYENIENTDTYTFNGIDVGGTGLVVLAFTGEGNNGVDASAVAVTSDEYSNIEAASAGPIEENASIWYVEIPDPLDTTIDVAVSTSAVGLRGVLGVWRIDKYSSSTPIYADGTSTESTNTQSLTTSSLPANSVVMGAASEKVNGGTSFTWSGLTENYDTITSEANGTFSGASTQVSSSGALTVSATVPTGEGSSMVVAAWR